MRRSVNKSSASSGMTRKALVDEPLGFTIRKYHLCETDPLSKVAFEP